MRKELKAWVNPCQHQRHGGDDPRICQDCGVALDIPTYDPAYPRWRKRLKAQDRTGDIRHG